MINFNLTSFIIFLISFFMILDIILIIIKWDVIDRKGKISLIIHFILGIIILNFMYFDFSKSVSNKITKERVETENNIMFQREEINKKILNDKKVKETYINSKNEIEEEANKIHNSINNK